MTRILRLDGLRAIAFLTIFVHHAFGIPHLWAGVDIFFVLSGFLITSILMDGRGKQGAWGRFYERRALRILPPYGAFLLLATFLLHLHWDHKGLWYALFAMNFAEVLGVGVPGLGILWSLGCRRTVLSLSGLSWLFGFRLESFLRCSIALMVLAPIFRGVATPFLT